MTGGSMHLGFVALNFGKLVPSRSARSLMVTHKSKIAIAPDGAASVVVPSGWPQSARNAVLRWMASICMEARPELLMSSRVGVSQTTRHYCGTAGGTKLANGLSKPLPTPLLAP